MSETLGFFCVVTWLALGGWAFHQMSDKGDDTKGLGAFLVVSVLFAPFVFGAAVNDLQFRGRKAREQQDLKAASLREPTP